jgi:murein tripeptide amidase MpaA
VQYTTFQLLKQYGVDAGVTRLMDSVVFHVVPVMNPDGYDYSVSELCFRVK